MRKSDSFCIDGSLNEEDNVMFLLQTHIRVTEKINMVLGKHFHHWIGEAQAAHQADEDRTERQLSNTSSQYHMKQQVSKSPLVPVSVTLKKLVWLHIPKCGTSFVSTLLHHACGINVSPSLSEIDAAHAKGGLDAFGEHCPGSLLPTFWSDFDHSPVSNNASLESVAMMIRDPRHRVLSGYHNGLHGCTQMQHQMKCSNFFSGGVDGKCHGDIHFDGEWIRDPSVINPVEYARCVENCTVNMLSGRSCAFHGHADVEFALSRVAKLGFVGLTEEWALSICLFHAKFGGPLLTNELVNNRPGPSQISSMPKMVERARNMLDAWPATNEMQVYQAAVARFWREIELYQLSRESCQNQIA